MQTYSTRQAAAKLGITGVSLGNYIKSGKVPEPQIMNVGGRNIHVWTEAEIEHVRQLLPRIANGRKTRYKKKHSAVSKTKTEETKEEVNHQPAGSARCSKHRTRPNRSSPVWSRQTMAVFKNSTQQLAVSQTNEVRA